jgi:hypothetical protein
MTFTSRMSLHFLRVGDVLVPVDEDPTVDVAEELVVDPTDEGPLKTSVLPDDSSGLVQGYRTPV